MGKERKSVPFSTRWTESMDLRLEEISEVMMLTKQDIVRMALSEFLVKHRELIDSNIEYKENPDNIRYEGFELMKIDSSNVVDSGWWVNGIHDYLEDGTITNFDDLVKIEVNMPNIRDISKLPELLNKLGTTTDDDSQLESIKSQINEMVRTQIYEEYTLKFTKYGLAVKEDPKFKKYLENSIQELIDDLKKKNN